MQQWHRGLVPAYDAIVSIDVYRAIAEIEQKINNFVFYRSTTSILGSEYK